MNDTIRLHPLTVGELLDRAFRLYRYHFLLLFSIVAMAELPVTILSLLGQALLNSGLVVNSVIRLVTTFPDFFAIHLIYAALIVAISCAYLNQPVALGRAYTSGVRRYTSLIGASFLIGLAFGVPVIVLMCLSLAATANDRTMATLIATFLITPVALIFLARWEVYMPAIILEDIGAVEGLSRSWRLTAGYFWRVVGILLATTMLNYAVAVLPRMLITYGYNWAFPGSQIGPYLTIIVNKISMIILWPFSTAVTVLLYYDLRVRKEGFDLEWMAQQMAAQSETGAGEGQSDAVI